MPLTPNLKSFRPTWNLTALYLGLHPDEATEVIIDTALRFDIPFAVIPCCVFSALFPERRLKSGGEPTSYEDFCLYLAEKSDRIQTCQIPFLGRNTVLFTLPQRVQ